MNELKPEDVMRGLECHATDYKPPMEGIFHCKTDCPYHPFDFCTRVLAKDALALLREKDAEIERLNKTLDAMVIEHNRLITLTKTNIVYRFADRLIARARDLSCRFM